MRKAVSMERFVLDRRHRPADDTPRKQIQHDGQVDPAFIGPDRGNIAGPLLIGTARGKILIQQIRRHARSRFAFCRGCPMMPTARESPRSLIRRATRLRELVIP